MIKLLISTLLLSFFFLPSVLFAQELPALVKKVEKVIEKDEPAWKIEHPYVQMSPPVMHLKSAHGDVLIYFWLMDSEKTAKEIFDGNGIAIRKMLGKRKREIKLAGFGNESYLISNSGGGFAHIGFLKNSIYISVAAPTEKIAKKFALKVLEEISVQNDANKKGLALSSSTL